MLSLSICTKPCAFVWCCFLQPRAMIVVAIRSHNRNMYNFHPSSTTSDLQLLLHSTDVEPHVRWPTNALDAVAGSVRALWLSCPTVSSLSTSTGYKHSFVFGNNGLKPNCLQFGQQMTAAFTHLVCTDFRRKQCLPCLYSMMIAAYKNENDRLNVSYQECSA